MTELEQQVTSPEISTYLKQLGLPQSAYWRWYFGGYFEKKPCLIRNNRYKKVASAFSVAELGEFLPEGIVSGKTSWKDKPRKYICNHYAMEMCNNCHPDIVEVTKNCLYGETEADARGKMLIYLIENKLIKL